MAVHRRRFKHSDFSMSDFTKLSLAYLIANSASFICFGAATYLAAHEKPGWGWFLFVGILCAKVGESKTRKTGVDIIDKT
jgi:hypothetical protein